MDWLSISVLFLIGLVIVTTFVLYLNGVKNNNPFFNWFELHYTMAVIGILAIVLLANMGKLEQNTVTTLFGSLVAYVLGASTGKIKPVSQQTPPTGQTQSSVSAGSSQGGSATGSSQTAQATAETDSSKIPV